MADELVETYEVNGVPIYTSFQALDLLANDTLIGFDLETSGFSPFKNNIATVQLYGDDSGVGVMLHVRCVNHRLPVEVIQFFENTKARLVGHNIVAFDCLFLASHGVNVYHQDWYDSMLAEIVVAGYGRKDVKMSLKETLVRKLDVAVDKDIDHGGWMNPVLDEEHRHYAMSDVIHLPALYRAQAAKAVETKQAGAVAFEMDLIPAVLAMEFNGIPVSVDRMEAYLRTQAALADQAKEEILDVLGDKFLESLRPAPIFLKSGKESAVSVRVRATPTRDLLNLDSPMQLKEAFRLGLGLELDSTSEEALMEALFELEDENNTIRPERQIKALRALLRYREGHQRIKMYGGDWIEKYVVNGVAHPQFRQCGADTGRFTCKNPNLQQVPKEPTARQVFCAPEGYKIVSGDYAAIEVRIAALIASDTALISALSQSDVHTYVASMIFNKKPEEVTKKERQRAKAASFNLLFGGGYKLLYKKAKLDGSDITEEEALQLFNIFMGRFEGVKKQRDWAVNISKTRRVVWITLPSGMKRMLTGDTLRPTVILNTMVQGTAGAGLKNGLIYLTRNEPWILPYLSLTVHDEVVLCVPDSLASLAGEVLSKWLVKGMEDMIARLPGGRSCPILVEVTTGQSWGG